MSIRSIGVLFCVLGITGIWACGGGISDRMAGGGAAGVPRIYVAGNFTSWNGQTARGIVRLLPDGSRDPDFASLATLNDAGAASAAILALAEAPDGSGIFIGGNFAELEDAYGPVSISGLAKLNHDGTIDRSFLSGGKGTNLLVRALEVHDGYLYVGGDFTIYTDQPGIARGIQRLMRVDLKTSVPDTTFMGHNEGLAGGTVFAFAFHDEYLLVGFLGSDTNYIRDEGTILDVDHGMRIHKRTGVFTHDLNMSSRINSLVVSGNLLYLGGVFNQCLSDSDNNQTCMIDLDTMAVVASWKSGAGTGAGATSIIAQAMTPAGLAIGGSFTTFSGDADQEYLALLDAGSAAVDAGFAPGARGPSAQVEALAYAYGALWVGGGFAAYTDGTGARNVQGLIKVDLSGEAYDEFVSLAGSGVSAGDAVYRILPATVPQ